MYRALQLIFRQARAVPGDVMDSLSRDYAAEAKREFARSITVTGGEVGPSGGSFHWERR